MNSNNFEPYELVMGDYDNGVDEGVEQRFSIANITVHPEFNSTLVTICENVS
jgi:hypothetical protein